MVIITGVKQIGKIYVSTEPMSDFERGHAD